MLPGILIKKKLQNNMKYFFCYFFVSITFIFYLNAQNGHFVTNTILTTKYFFDKKYLVKDSLLKVKWKLTGEKRNIAGLECKRANAIILDSLYIVVFFF